MYSGEKADRELEIRTTGWPAGNYWIVVGGVSYSWIKLGGY